MTAADSNDRSAAATASSSTTEHPFQNVAPARHIERMRRHKTQKNELGIALSEVFLGIALAEEDEDDDDDENKKAKAKQEEEKAIEIGFACHDGTYNIDFAVHSLRSPEAKKQKDIADYVVRRIGEYEREMSYKFVGAGLSRALVETCPEMSSRLWSELDIVPVVIVKEEVGEEEEEEEEEEGGRSRLQRKSAQGGGGVDEMADSMARKCLEFFGPSFQPRVEVGFANRVEVDLSNRARLASLEQYRATVNARTWKAATKYAESLKEKKTKIAFFSATPQGGGVALMRHALIRFFRLVGVDCTWWVPKPKPEVFRITKTNHNILQAVAKPDERLSEEQQATIRDWVQGNAERFWLREGGPLTPASKGGADVIIVDDPQMPNIIDIAKEQDPDRPVIFRSHIQIRADLADDPKTPTGGVWSWLWQSVRHSDLFLAHPVSAFVPKDVDRKKLAYMPATTDWLDGLNKELRDFDLEYYQHEFNTECLRQRMVTLQYPERDYIVQIARFDPSKGIPDVLASYAEFRRTSSFCSGKSKDETPQLVIAGHYSVDDPDGVRVLEETLGQLENEYRDIKNCVVVMRLGPTDQLLNTLMSNARVALQLSTREGFEVKVSEALHKGVPVIATRTGGIPLQVQPEKSGFLVEPGDHSAVAKYLDTLFTDAQRYESMSKFAAAHVSDEVGTVGNAVNWMFLADQLSQGRELKPNGKWIWDLAKDEVGELVREEEVRLPRDWTT